MDAPRIFLSYARADRDIAERLRMSLEAYGCIVHDPAAAGGDLGGSRASVPYDDLEEAAQKSDQFVLLFGEHRDRDVVQEQEWQAALEATWEDASKKMIPILLGDAELPNFVRGAAGTGRSTMGLQVNGPREADQAAKWIAEKVGATAKTRSAVVGRSETDSESDDVKHGYSLGVEDGSPIDEDPREKQPPRAPVYRSLPAESTRGGFAFTVEPPSRKEIAARFEKIKRYVEELES